MTQIARRTKGQSTRLLRFPWGLIVTDTNRPGSAAPYQVFHVVPVKLKLRHEARLKRHGISFERALATLRPGLLQRLPSTPTGVRFASAFDAVKPMDRNELFAILVNGATADRRTTDWLSAFAQNELGQLMAVLDTQLAEYAVSSPPPPTVARLTQRIATWTKLHAIDPLAASLGATPWPPRPGTQGSLLMPRPTTIGGAA
jgi:hypothetical protein